MPIEKELLNMLDLGRKPFQLVFFTLAKIAKDKGANPQRVSTEIIIEIKQLNTGRIASFTSSQVIAVMVFPLRDHLFIENGVLD